MLCSTHLQYPVWVGIPLTVASAIVGEANHDGICGTPAALKQVFFYGIIVSHMMAGHMAAPPNYKLASLLKALAACLVQVVPTELVETAMFPAIHGGWCPAVSCTLNLRADHAQHALHSMPQHGTPRRVQKQVGYARHDRNHQG
jgi:hypothetical protein